MAENRRGVTLTELMVAVALVGVGILGFFGAFSFISKSLHVSRSRTLASNLAQEKIEILKNLAYDQLLITTTSAVIPGFSPSLYDTANYPPESISISGITFTRYTYVTLVQVSSDVVSAVGYTYPDTGMKQITVSVAWSDGGDGKIWVLNNLLENPNISALDSGFSGVITSALGGALPGALVLAEENPNRFATSGAGGAYSFSISHGSYTIRASSAGFYDAVATLTAASAGSYASVNLSLSAIATGTITGSAWFNPGVVISQVVASTPQANGYDVEYLELFNPTQTAATVSGGINLNFVSGNNNTGCTNIPLTYVNTVLPANRYFIVANTTTFMVNGGLVTADAYYTDTANASCSPGAYNWNPPTVRDIMHRGHSGTWWLTDSSGNVLDAVGWTNNGATHSPSHCNGTCIPQTAGGLPVGQQIVRTSSPAYVNSGFGRAYNSGSNAADFAYPGNSNPALATTNIQYSPFNSSQSSVTVLAGVPAVGAEVAATDAFSGSTQAVAAYISTAAGSQLYAPFTLAGVTTGTWNVEIATAGYSTEVDTVTVSQGLATSVGGVLLASSSAAGFIKGQVTDIYNLPLNGILVQAGGVTKTTGANGAYFALASTGPVSVYANPNNANPAYVQQIAVPTVSLGQVTAQDFTLSQGGAIQGYLTTGTSPLANFLVVATSGGSEAGEGSSDNSGSFTIRNISTGTYVVSPAVNSGQTSSPSSLSVTMSGAASVFIGTFTVSGAFGTIAGSVTYNGSLVTSGALIVASTGTVTAPPATIYGSSCTAQIPVYAISTLADGTYQLPVRAASNYNLLVAMPTVNSDGSVSIVSKTYSNIAVSASSTTTQGLALP